MSLCNFLQQFLLLYWSAPLDGRVQLSFITLQLYSRCQPWGSGPTLAAAA
jgi:hypothetical protein